MSAKKTNREIVIEIDQEIKNEEPILTPKNELFCRYYTTAGPTFSNQTLSYALAYGYDLDKADRTNEKDEDGKEIPESSEYHRMYHYVAMAGSRNMNLDKIIKRVRQLMVDNFNNDAVMDARLAEIATGGKDADSIQAIKHRSELKNRITKKVDINATVRPLVGMTDEELQKLAGE